MINKARIEELGIKPESLRKFVNQIEEQEINMEIDKYLKRICVVTWCAGVVICFIGMISKSTLNTIFGASFIIYSAITMHALCVRKSCPMK